MIDNNPHSDQDEIEYVGAPTEYADAEEVPEWVANIAKILFFLPAAFVTATTIPIILFVIVLVSCLMMSCLLSVFV
ncbi:MAG: hypothetical protein JXA10_10940 [Anaerolineae bacterium]|nr:hypothetical protein [Anaerolineae bacterium]